MSDTLDLSGFDNIETSDQGATLNTKKGVADIVFLIDVSGSMGPAIGSLAKNITTFVQNIDPNMVKDWRARVVTYSDLDTDSTDVAFDASRPFISHSDSSPVQSMVDQLKNAHDLVKKQGGGDVPESTLEALYKTVTDTTIFDQDWSERTRAILVFTDAVSKEINSTRTIGAEVDGLQMLAQLINENHTRIFIYAPSDDKIQTLANSAANYISYMSLTPQEGVDPVKALQNIDFTKAMETIAKEISRHSIIA